MFLALLSAPVALTYARILRPHVLNWGATDVEVGATMEGDEVLSDAVLQTTRAVTIDAPPSDVWPWLVQMGPRPRAGAYTYDWLERLLGIDIENSDRILPEFQHMEAGDSFLLNDKGEGLAVREVEHERHIVLQWVPARSTWTFALRPCVDGTTRLVSRNRLPSSGPLFWPFMIAFMEPGSLVMERKMLLGIKERAERLHRDRLAATASSTA
jgi:hypothetical protein